MSSSGMEFMGTPFAGLEKKLVRVYGRNSDVDDTLEDVIIQGGQYVFPPNTGIQMRIVSSSANDTVSGTGARSVDIHYLDSNLIEQRIFVDLSGTTAALTSATDIRRINGFHVQSVGSNNTAAGNIQLQNTAGTITYGYIQAGFNANESAIYTIPSGYTGYITSLRVGSGSGSGQRYSISFLRCTTNYEDTYNQGVFQIKDTILVQDCSYASYYQSPIIVPEFTDIRVSTMSDAITANASVTAMMEIYLRNNNQTPTYNWPQR